MVGFPTESTLKELRTAITYIKNMALTEEIEGLETDLASLLELYRRYQAALETGRGRWTTTTRWCLRCKFCRLPPVLAYFQQRYKYFCVDESWDTLRYSTKLYGCWPGAV